MSWARAKFAAAMADSLESRAALLEAPPAVFAAPPLTCNPPALVVGRPTEVVYGTGGLGIDVATIPIVCIGPQEGEDVVDGLIATVRGVIAGDSSVGGAVQIVTAPSERNWRAVRIAGADLLAADVVLTVQM